MATTAIVFIVQALQQDYLSTDTFEVRWFFSGECGPTIIQ